MSLPPAYRVGLGLYEIDPETLGLRRQIWEIPEPHLAAIADRHIGVVATHTNAITEIAARVAQAVNEQVAATDSIAASASKAAVNTATVADVLRTVEEAVRTTQATAASVLGVSRSLSEKTGEIDAAMNVLFAAASQLRGVKRFSNLSSAMA